MALAGEVAKYIIKSLPVDNLKLQKLLYYSQAVHLVLNGKTPLFREPIEAWDYGPVVPAVYHEYKKFGLEFIPCLDESVMLNLVSNEIECISMVLGYYGQMSGLDLVNKTHQESPWKLSYRPGFPSNIIPIDLIYNYFKDVLVISED